MQRAAPLAARFLTLVHTTGLLYLLLNAAFRPWFNRWGATDDEVAAALPGDDLVPTARSQSTQAVTIDAPPEKVWLWLAQMGWGRGGFYTYEWFENLILRLGIHNADRIVPGWQNIQRGDRIWYYPEGYPLPRIGPRVERVEPNQELLLCHQVTDDPTSCPGTWQFILRPAAVTVTRLILRGRNGDSPSAWFDRLAEPGYFWLTRGMLEGIKARAEGRPVRSASNRAVGVLWAIGFGVYVAAAVRAVVRPRWMAPHLVALSAFAVLYVLAIRRPRFSRSAPLVLSLLAGAGLAQGTRPWGTRRQKTAARR